MKKHTSRLMMIGIAMLALGGSHRAAAQLPFCPPFCQVKADSKAKPNPRATPQKKAKKLKKQVSA